MVKQPNTTLSLNFSKLFANFVGRVSWNEHIEAKGQSVLESKRTVIGPSKPSGGGYSEPVQKLNTVARETPHKLHHYHLREHKNKNYTLPGNNNTSIKVTQCHTLKLVFRDVCT